MHAVASRFKHLSYRDNILRIESRIQYAAGPEVKNPTWDWVRVVGLVINPTPRLISPSAPLGVRSCHQYDPRIGEVMH